MPYEVTGRADTPSGCRSAGTARCHAQQALLDWQSVAWDSLLDEDRAAEAGAYGLYSASSPPGPAARPIDLADALRWRLHRDPAAAERAGLSNQERDLLAAPGLLDSRIRHPRET